MAASARHQGQIVVDPGLDQSLLISRYYTFSKFIDLIETQSLFLPMADSLEDKFEGHPQLAASTGVGSWTHYDESESYLMWKAYTSTVDGLLILTRVENLVEALHPPGFLHAYIGAVLYGSQKPLELPNHDIQIFFHKRKIYEREREIRIVASLLELGVSKTEQDFVERSKTDGGIAVPTDIPKMIEKVILAPDAPPRLIRLIQSICERNGVQAPRTRSELSHRPESGSP